MKTKVLFIILICLSVFCEENIVTHSITGKGTTYRNAINDGLMRAVEQYCGVIVDASARSYMLEREISVSSLTPSEKQRLEIRDRISKEMEKWAKGCICGYSVVKESVDQETRLVHVELAVQFPGRYVVGTDPNSRRRMVVLPFYPKDGVFPVVSVLGKTAQTRGWIEALDRTLNIQLTQTRKFTMLDRAFDKEVNRELSRSLERNASLKDFVLRNNQKLGTDYLVVGSVSFRNVDQPVTDPYTLKPLPNQTMIFAEVHYRLLLAPTGQLKWANTLKIDIRDFVTRGLSFDEMISQAAERAGVRISDDIMAYLLPFEIVNITKDGRVVIGEGGKSLAEGEYFIVYALGDVVTDTRTGEKLDEVETQRGVVQVTRVTPKISYAKVIQGDIGTFSVGCRLRRPITGKIMAPAVHPGTTKPLENGGVQTPF